MFSVFKRIFFPDNIKCMFCGNDIPNFDQQPFCNECQKKLEFNIGHKCRICDDPILNEAEVCDRCQKQKRYFKKAVCPLVYCGEGKNSILSFKENNQRFKAKGFAILISKCIFENKLQIDYITFVPMTAKKQKERTFNQSKLLAEELAKLMNVEVIDIFEKTSDTKSQKTSTFLERQKNALESYALKSNLNFAGKNILIVDDVLTTCSTVNALSALIYKSAKNVYACAIARDKSISQTSS